MIVFTLNDVTDLEIIPVQLNVIFNNILVCKEQEKIENPVPDLFTEAWGNLIKKYILESKKTTYVIDMDGIKGAEKVFESFIDIENTNLIYINCKYLIPQYLKAAYREGIIGIENDTFINSNAKLYIEKVFVNCENFYQRIRTYYSEECAKKLDKEGICKEITLNRSSNVYATAYVDIRNLLSKKDNISLFLYGLYKKLRKFDGYDSFVVVSNNGAILANVLSDIFKKPVLHLLNLGPKIAIKDNEINTKLKKGYKYIYIYDFLCLGNEYKLLNMLLKMNGAKLIKGIGIAQLLPSERYSVETGRPESIVCLKDYPDIFTYKIACYKEEL